MAITMARDLEKTGNPINIIHGDNDSTTKFRLQADFPYVEKRDDTNHTKKNASCMPSKNLMKRIQKS